MDDLAFIDLVNGYIEGRLSEQESSELLAEIAASPSRRDALAGNVLAHRLMRSSRLPPVPPDKIMKAVAAAKETSDALPGAERLRRSGLPRATLSEQGRNRHRFRSRSASDRSSPRSPPASRSPLPAAIALALIALACWMLWSKWKVPSPADGGHPQPAPLAGMPAGGGPPAPQPSPTLSPSSARSPAAGQPASRPPVEVRLNAMRASTNAAASTLAALPATNAVPPDAAGDGSGEPGFVPPRSPRSSAMAASPDSVGAAAEPVGRNMPLTGGRQPPHPPVLFAKLQMGESSHWNATPGDVAGLLRRVREKGGVEYGVRLKTLDEIDPNPESNPILFLTGHYRFRLTPEQRHGVRQFLLNGGMLVLNTGLGSLPFYESARRELLLMFPDRPLLRLQPDHPLLHAYFDTDRVEFGRGVRQAGYEGDTPWFDGITIDCRTVAVISRWGMAWGWQGEDAAENAAYASSDALRLGQNLIAYATATRAWARQAAARVQFPAEEWPSAGALSMVQVIYDGEWKTRAKGPSILLQTFNRKTDVPVKFNLRQLRLSSPDLFDSPLLYLTGHEGFHIEPDEATRLREYLLNGGSLLAEACCGRKAFGRAFEAEMARLLPEFPLLPIPSDAGLFKLPNPIQTLHVTPALAAVAGRDSVAPPLKVATLNGRYAVIYSPYGMAGGWEMSQSPYALGYSDDSAIRLGQNILLCAITQ